MTRSIAITLALAVFAFAAPLVAKDDDAERAELRERSKEILADLYKAKPSAKAGIESAAGYATFSNFGMKIFLAGGGKGAGIAVRNKGKQTTYMKMVEVQAGLGLGIKKFSLIFVFETQAALYQIVNSGWEFGGQATAAAKAGDAGGSLQGAVAVGKDTWLYQLTEGGLAAELTLKSTKFYKDKDLD
jgi:lipid-binding SYLF domain-containing protein